MKNRKLIVFIVDTLLLAMFFVLTVFFAPEALIGIGITLAILETLIGVTYIGGNVLATWAKSKYFHSELVEKE